MVGAIAWFFTRDKNVQAFDWFFVDEAGQAGLANMASMGRAARNIVLVCDPRQLPQVIQGAHPEPANYSCLEWLLGEHATVPPDRGIFLPVSRRLAPLDHPALHLPVHDMSFWDKKSLATAFVIGLGPMAPRWLSPQFWHAAIGPSLHPPLQRVSVAGRSPGSSSLVAGRLHDVREIFSTYDKVVAADLPVASAVTFLKGRESRALAARHIKNDRPFVRTRGSRTSRWFAGHGTLQGLA
jgi:hypothetical protein